MTDFTRRKVLGVAVGTMAATSAGLIEAAAADDAADLDLFVKVSAALTGISEFKLAPQKPLAQGVDPIQVKVDYFEVAKIKPGFPGLMQIARDGPTPAAAAQKIATSADLDIKFLGRSIILAWYLGAWYPRDVLDQPPTRIQPEKIISAKAYTQGWTWSVAQAHPMGFSDLRFGHWSDPPLPLDTLIKA
jgi:hypothetical protein